MFDALSPAEALALSHRLASGAHKFAEVGSALAQTALADRDAPDFAPIWNRSARYYAGMTELHDIRDEVRWIGA
jgi:hypothetical protein